MSFGSILAIGDQNNLLPEQLMGCVTEVRVEQFLDRPTEFAVRFEEDITDNEPRITSAPELQAERMMTIAVPAGSGDVLCLVRGPITDVHCSTQLGGPGSYIEVRGQDRRVELDRQCFRHAWEGRASECADTILSGYDFETDIQETTRVYSEDSGTLNQRGSDLAFLNQIMAQNNLCFWLDYTCRLSSLDPDRRRMSVTERANLKSSPPRPADSRGASAPIQLAPTTQLRLRVNVDPSQCQTVTTFELSSSAERPNRHTGTALNDRDVEIEDSVSEDRQPPIRPNGRTLTDMTGEERQICVTSPGDSEELNPRAESALTEAGWFVNATASTTAYALGGVLIPHDVVEVEGMGRRHSGPYQVKQVTHVINAADHRMDLQLRRNAVGAD